MQWLRERTREEHLAIEQVVPLARADLSLETYARYLEWVYGYHAAIEPRFRGVRGWIEAVPDWPLREKLPLLRDDLRALQRSEGFIDALATPGDLPRLDTLADAFGAAYVLEGSTLGARFLSRHVRETVPALRDARLHYLDAYGEQRGAKWAAFRDALEAYEAGDAARREGIARAAMETFRTMREWVAGGARR